MDATQEYTEGEQDRSLLKYVTVMICIAVSGKPIAGVIHQPFESNSNGVTKWGWVDHGISNSLKAAQKKQSETDNMKVIFSRSHAGQVSGIADSAFGTSIEKIIAGGSGYKALQVVEGNANLYLHTTAIKKWDICAGNAVLNAVGGRMTTLKGREIDYSFRESARNEDGIAAAVSERVQQQYLKKLTHALENNNSV